MKTWKRQFKEKDWLFHLWNDQLSPFLKSLEESHKITNETSDQIRRSLMMNADELKKNQMEHKEAISAWIPSWKSWFENVVLVSPEWNKDELLKKMKEQNYFRKGDKIKTIDELRDEYVSFVKNGNIEMKKNQLDIILKDLNKAKLRKANLKISRDDFIKKNDEEQKKCDDKIWVLKKELQKKWYKENI